MLSNQREHTIDSKSMSSACDELVFHVIEGERTASDMRFVVPSSLIMSG